MRGHDRVERRGADLLSPLETFEHYENRSRPPSAAGQWATDHNTPTPPTRYTSNRSIRQQQGYNQGVRSAISHRSPTYAPPAAAPSPTSHLQPIPSGASNNGRLACEYRSHERNDVIESGAAARSYDPSRCDARLACEYRNDPRLAQPLRPLVTDARQEWKKCGGRYGPPSSTLACEYRAAEQQSPAARTATVTTSYQPQPKSKLPLRWILCISISVPIFVIIFLFAAVQLQELGLLR